MHPDTLFSLSSSAVLPGWALLVFAPRWRWSHLAASVVLPLLLGLLYAFLIVGHFFGAPGGFGSLSDVRTLFANPALLLAGWIHYLAFDLFVGAWEVREAGRLAIPHWMVVPCLLLTFMFGPVGLFLFFVVRGAVRGAVEVGGASR